MTDTYTTSLRLTQPQVGASTGSWPTSLNTDMALLDTAIAGRSTVSINGLTTYTLTANNGSADQARAPVYIFTGTLAADCTVTLPAAVKFGWAVNNTTGGFSVILSAGGVTATVSSVASALWTFFQCDGTDVTLPTVRVGAANVIGALAAGSAVVSGALTVGGTATVNALIVAAAAAVTGGITSTVAALGSTLIDFEVTGTGMVGAIVSTLGGGTTYNTTSDYRLKTLFGPFQAGDILDAVPVHEGVYKVAPTDLRALFTAHEVQAQMPWAVTGHKDATGDDGNMIPQMLDHSALVPVLWAEVRALRERVRSLEQGVVRG